MSEKEGITGADRDAAVPASEGRARLLGVLACAAAVIACEAIVFRYLFQYGVSNIWRYDGAAQHLPGLLYFHEWVTAVLSGRGAEYGLWSWRLGLGADVLTTLSYYVADPFALLSLPFPRHLIEYVYEGIFFLRILCAGLAGYAYLRAMKATRFAAIAGTLVYVFSGFVLQISLRHPYFDNALVWFPLILLGIEHVLRGRRWYLLVGALAVAAASNVYFFYQMAIIAALYAVVRYVEVTKPGERLRRLAAQGSRMGGLFVLGTLLASFMLVPVALAILTSSRMSADHAVYLLHPARTYAADFLALFTARGGVDSLFGGFAMIGFMSAAVVFVRRGNTALKSMLVAFALFPVSPVFGRLFNGFSFPSYRFYFMAGLFLAAAVAILLSDTRPLSRRELAVTGIALAVVTPLSLVACALLGYRYILVVIPLGIGALTWGLFALERHVRTSGTRFGTPARVAALAAACRRGAVVLMVAGIAAAGVADLSKTYNPALKSYLPLGTALERYVADPGSEVASLPFDGLQRTDKQSGALRSNLRVAHRNDPLVQGYAGLEFYFSIMNGRLHEYAMGLADRSKRFAFDIEGFDDRAVLDTLAGVRYYVAAAEGAEYVPYGFAPVSGIETATVYENRHALPVGYVYHAVIDPEAYAAMHPLDKQQALLQGVVLEGGAAAGLPRIAPPSETVEVTYTLDAGPGLEWDQAGRRVSSRKKGASAMLRFSAVPDSETYIEMAGVRFPGTARLAINVNTGGASKMMRLQSPSENYYWGNETALLNLGYYETGIDHARITLPARNDVTYESLRVIAVPMARYPERVGRLATEGMRDVRVGADTVSGTVTSRGDGLLFLSIPYSVGWTATVDGRPTPIVPANVAFSGIAITSGTHDVVLRYMTPGLPEGAALSLLALAAAVGLAVRTERRLATGIGRGIPRPDAGREV